MPVCGYSFICVPLQVIASLAAQLHWCSEIPAVTACVIWLERSSAERDLDDNACHASSVDDEGRDCAIAPPGWWKKLNHLFGLGIEHLCGKNNNKKKIKGCVTRCIWVYTAELLNVNPVLLCHIYNSGQKMYLCYIYNASFA